MADIKRLVFSIIEFFDDQIVSGDLSEDALESLEVAKQCLETAYSLNLSTDTEYRVSRSLLDIFNQSVGKNEGLQPRVPTRQATDEEKAEAEKLKSQGNDLMKQEKYDDAIDYYSKAITLDGRNAVFYSNRAAAYSKVNEHEKSIEDCKVAIAIDPQYSKAYGRMGLAYASLNDFQSAKDCYSKALSLDPSNESYKSNLRTAEERLAEVNSADGARAGVSTGPGDQAMPNLANFDLAGLMSNPAVMNMAQSLMSSPQMSSMLANMLSGAAAPGSGAGAGAGAPAGEPQSGAGGGAPPPGNMNDLMSTTLRLAQQMQNQNPELVDSLRRNINNPNSSSQDPSQPGPDNSNSGSPPS